KKKSPWAGSASRKKLPTRTLGSLPTKRRTSTARGSKSPEAARFKEASGEQHPPTARRAHPIVWLSGLAAARYDAVVIVRNATHALNPFRGRVADRAGCLRGRQEEHRFRHPSAIQDDRRQSRPPVQLHLSERRRQAGARLLFRR